MTGLEPGTHLRHFPQIIEREAVVVKALHPLGPISSLLTLSPEIQVPLEPTVRSGSPVPVVEPRDAARHALELPLNFPPLAQATVPGDRLAIAVDESVPLAVDVVKGVVDAAEHAGFERELISVVTVDAELAARLRDKFGDDSDGGVHIVVHDPDDAENLCPVGLTGQEWLLINRTIFDADVVLPIGCARLTESTSGGVYESLYPRFCDTATIERLRTPAQRRSVAKQMAAQEQADEAGWLVGAPMVVQVVPGRNGTVAAVVAGDPQAVAENCQRVCQELWSFRVAQRASLVIASVTGDRQSWENIGRALSAAASLLDEGGAIAICSDLDAPLGPAVGRLLDNPDLAAIERELRKDQSPDSWPAWLLARALQRGPVYFLSELDEQTVEDLGLAPIAGIDELARLAGRQESCIVLDDSQHAVATVAGE